MAEKVVRLMPGVDIRKFKLDPTDGFLLTRVDSRRGAKDLARETGLPDFSVARTLEKLEKMGIVEIVDPDAPPPAPPPPERRSAIAQFEEGLFDAKYDPKELEEPAELPPEQKKRILDFYYRLDDLDHYTLLGVTKEADKKAVKRSYFELAAVFHPDRYYKKSLGSFKAKMEVLFNRITDAHDALVDPEKRTEYDAYLQEVATTRGMEVMLERAMVESARATAAAATAATAAAATAAATAAAAPPAAPPPPSGPSADEIQARREALARRLTGGKAAPQAARGASARPNPLRFGNPQDAMDALKRRYEDRIESATQAQAQRYIATAEEALAKNDLVAAATALGIATKFAPEDAGLAMRAQEVKSHSDKTLAESYQKQAQYEERQGHWTEASRNWLKVAKIKKDAFSHERAANAVHRSQDGDLREAAEHAKQAVSLEPENVANHVTLAEVYLKAGLAASARKACEVATQLDPNHAGLQVLLKRFQKP